MIDFINALQHACKLTQEAMTAGELADTLWLIHVMSSAQQEYVGPEERESFFLQPVHESPVHNNMKQIAELAHPVQQVQLIQPDSEEKTTSNVHPYPTSLEPFDSSVAGRNGTKGSMPVSTRDIPALHNALALGRALRPLRQRYPSRKSMVMNERATAHQIAEMRQHALAPFQAPVPVMESSLERWFELVLVIDTGISMQLWQQTILEVRKLFETVGAFRNIPVWSLATNDETDVQLYAGMGTSSQEHFEHKPEELLDPTGRRLILVVTDCVSPAWHSGAVQKVLEIWGTTTQVTLLQMLPWRLWPTTALCFAENEYISSAFPGAPNVRLKTPEFQLPAAIDTSFTGDTQRMNETRPTPFPVITLEEESFSAWASMVMGIEDAKVAGVMFAKNSYILPSQQKDTMLNTRKRARNFLAAASPTARKLAQLLSVTSIVSPVVRVIGQTLVPEVRQEHVAEVFLSGMLQKPAQNGTAKQQEYTRYEFYPEAREELWATLSLEDEAHVHQEVSRYCEKQLGITRNNFSGVVDAPFSFAELALEGENQSIADILVSEWRQLSSDDTFLADQLEEQIARTEPDKETRAIRLLALLPSLREEQERIKMMREAMAAMHGIACSKNYVVALLACLTYVPEIYKFEVTGEALESARLIMPEIERIEALLDCLPHVSEKQKVEVIERALESARLIIAEKERVAALFTLLQGLPEAWKAEAVQQMLTMARNMSNTAFKTDTLHMLLDSAPDSLTHVIRSEIAFHDGTRSGQMTNKFSLRKKYRTGPSRTEFVCPSCFYKHFMGDCRILSGIGDYRVLKPAPTSPRQIEQARKNPESLDTPFYKRELAYRECPSCGYPISYGIEQFPSVVLAIVGDTFSGKSHYIATLLYQLRGEWINSPGGYIHLDCLTPDEEMKYLLIYEQLFKKKQVLNSTQQLALSAKDSTKDSKLFAKPLIYNLSIDSANNEPPTTINLMLYDISGEDFKEENLVRVAPFALGADAFIFVVDPVTMSPVFERLPAALQENTRHAMQSLGLSLTERRVQPDSLNKTLALYQRFDRQRESMSLPDTPVAVMLSKADLIRYIPQAKSYSFTVNPRYDGSLDVHDIFHVDTEVKAFLREYGQGALLASTRILSHVQFFATSATGEPPDEQGYFQHIEPRRSLDPLLWILNQLGIITARV